MFINKKGEHNVRDITTEEFRELDKIARDLLNNHIQPPDLDSLENMAGLLDSIQDSMESATIITDGQGRDWVRPSEENFEIVEARVCQLLLLSVQAGGFEKLDAREGLWQ